MKICEYHGSGFNTGLLIVKYVHCHGVIYSYYVGLNEINSQLIIISKLFVINAF